MRRALSVLPALLLVSACFAAQPVKKTEVYLVTGGAFPTGDFNIKYDYGANVSAGLGIRAARFVRIVPKIEIQKFNIDPNAFLDSVSGGDYIAVMTGVDVRYFRDIEHWPFDPVAVVGAGLAFVSVNQLTVGDIIFNAHSETKLYLNVGVGFDMAVTPKVSAYALSRYVHIASGGDREQFFPISVGIRLPL